MTDATAEDDYDCKKVYVAVGDDDGTARVFSYHADTQHAKRVCIMEAPSGAGLMPPQPRQPYHTLGITSISWNATAHIASEEFDENAVGRYLRILTSSKDATCKIWHPWGGSNGIPKVQSFQEKEKSADGSSRGAERVVRHSNFVNSACWKTNGQDAGHQVMSCSDDGTAKVWDATTGDLKHTLHAEGVGHAGPVSSAAWSPDGSKILTSGHDQLCMLWSPKNGHYNKMFPVVASKDAKNHHVGPIWSAAFGLSGNRVVTASKDCSVRQWDCNTGQQILLLSDPKLQDPTNTTSHAEAVFGAHFNPHDSNEILSYSLDGTAKVWDSRLQGAPAMTISDHKAAVWTASYGNRTGTKLLTASHDMTSILYDKRRLQAIYVLAGHTGILWQAVLSPCDQYVVTCSDDRTARLWDLQRVEAVTHPGSGKTSKIPKSELLTDTLQPCKAAVTCAAFAPSDQEVLASV